MKVLLIQFTPYSMGSYGLLSLADALRARKHEVKICGTSIGVKHLLERPEARDIFQGTVRNFQPDVVGLSTMTPDADMITPFCRTLKETLGNVPIVCGGYHTLVFKGKVLEENPLLDYAFYGEGEENVPKLIKQIVSTRPNLSSIKGAIYRNGDAVIVNDLPDPVDFEQYNPARAYRELTHPDMRKTYKPSPYRSLQPMLQPNIPFLLARGCPYKCTFCQLYPKAPYPKMRFLSPKAFRKQLDYALETFKPKSIFINDSSLDLNKSWALEITQIIKETEQIYEWSCYVRPNLADEEFFQVLHDARCSLVLVYLEGGTDRIRNEILGKMVTDEQIRSAFRLADKHNMFKKTNLIVGCPTETESEFDQGARFTCEMRPDAAGFPTLTIIPGTALWEQYREQMVFDSYADFNISMGIKNLLRPELKVNFSKIDPQTLVRKKTALNVHFHSFASFLRERISLRDRSALIVQTSHQDQLGNLLSLLYNEFSDDGHGKVTILQHENHELAKHALMDDMEIIKLRCFATEMSPSDLGEKSRDVLIAAIYEETDELLAKCIRMAAWLKIKRVFFVNVREETLYEYDLKRKFFITGQMNVDLKEITSTGMKAKIEKQQIMIANRDRGIQNLKSFQAKLKTMLANRDESIEMFKKQRSEMQANCKQQERTIRNLEGQLRQLTHEAAP